MANTLPRLSDCSDDDLRVRGAAITNRLHDIGYAIDLEPELLIGLSSAASSGVCITLAMKHVQSSTRVGCQMGQGSGQRIV